MSKLKYIQSKNTLKTKKWFILVSEHATLSAFLEYACISLYFWGFNRNSVLFWTVDLNFTFVKIFGTVSRNFRWSKSPVYFWSSFELRKTGKSERPGKPKGRNFFPNALHYYRYNIYRDRPGANPIKDIESLKSLN